MKMFRKKFSFREKITLHPIMTILILIGVTIVLSGILSFIGAQVTYNKVDGGIHFTVWQGDTVKALSIVNEIISQIKAEHDDQKHGVSWRTISVEVTAETTWYVCVDWKYYVRDAG